MSAERPTEGTPALLVEMEDLMETVFNRLYTSGETSEVEDFVNLLKHMAENHRDPEVWALVGDWAGRKA